MVSPGEGTICPTPGSYYTEWGGASRCHRNTFFQALRSHLLLHCCPPSWAAGQRFRAEPRHWETAQDLFTGTGWGSGLIKKINKKVFYKKVNDQISGVNMSVHLSFFLFSLTWNSCPVKVLTRLWSVRRWPDVTDGHLFWRKLIYPRKLMW